MATLKRLRVEWAGSSIDGPAVSTFYVSDVTSGFPAAFLTFFNDIKALFPPGVTITIPNEGETISDLTGDLNGFWTDTGGGSVTGTGAGGYTRGVGIRIKWKTTGIFSGRRVVGSTFLVPADKGTFTTDGLPTTATVDALEDAGNNLIGDVDGDFLIWSRPNNVSLTNGDSNPVIAPDMPRRVSWLRSRRV